MTKKILSKLKQIEKQHRVTILYACESGSRAWGFPSKDSDYDVRFIYLRSIDWYLSLYPQSYVIELPIENSLDINGWDIKKALQLFAKSNPPFYEWLGSPIVYLETHSIVQNLRDLSLVFYSPMASLFHYLHMARGNFRQYLQSDQVWTKKYLYVLRPLLAILWIEKSLGVVPTDFNVLVQKIIVEPKLKSEISKLLELKMAGAELDEGPKIEIINKFIEQELNRFDHKTVVSNNRKSSTEKLDQLFLSLFDIKKDYNTHN